MRSHLILNRLLLVVVFVSHSGFWPTNIQSNSLDIDFSLRTPSNSTITFKTEEQTQGNGLEATTSQIPHLVLKRNGVLTADFERTLLVSVRHLSIPRSGLFLDLTVETQHADPDRDAENSSRIQIWHERQFLPYGDELTRSVDLSLTFDELADLGGETFQTPTDYYAYHLSLTDPDGEKVHEMEQDYAFLLENQWVAPLPQVLEQSAGAAPDEMIVYYCDMFSFQRDMRDPLTRLKRADVERYIQSELVPAMVHAFEVQSNVWGMTWYDEWTSYRAEDPQSLSVALAEYPTWYHGPAPTLGYESISIRVNGSFGEYASLTDGIMSVFYHELFHTHQRNISLHFRGNGDLSGKDEAWKTFSEGTAVLASAVGQPSVEFEAVPMPRSYVRRARAFLGQDGFVGGGLNKSYTEIPYHTALYWRFLYEHCGGLVNGTETPAAGMQVIRHILEIVYEGKVADIESSSDAVGALPRIVDLALQRTPACEFETYEESMLHFSEAIFRLRMQNRRNIESSYDSGEFFDPHHLYPVPDAEEYSIQSESGTLVTGSIPASYGIDLMELDLGPTPNHRSLKVLFESTDSRQDKFCLQVWQMQVPEAASFTVEDPGVVCTQDGQATLEIDPAGNSHIAGLGIAITRLDAREDVGVGEYRLSIHSE